MAVVGELSILLGLNNLPFLAGMAKSEAALRGFGATAGLALAGLGVAAAVVGVKSIESASKFEDAMALIHTQAGASTAEVEHMTRAVLAMAPAVATGPQTLAEGLYHIESAGIRGAQALDLLATSAKLAKVGHADLESTTNALVGVLNSGIGGFTGMSEAAGVTNAIIGAGNMRMEDLTAALSTGILPAARTFGVSFQSIGAAIATMTTNTVPAEEASTRLRMTLSLLGAPSHKAVKDLESIGIGHLQLAEDMRGPGGMLSAVQDLKTHLDASGLSLTQQAALLSDAFGGGRSSAGIMTLLGSLEKFQAVQDQVTAGTGAFGGAWEFQSHLPTTQWDRIRTSIESVVDSLGMGLIPALNDVFDKVVPVVTAFAGWAADNPGTMSTILMVLGAVSGLSIAVGILGPLIGALGLLLSPAALPFAAIAVAIALVVTHITEIQAGIQLVSDAVNKFVAEHGGFTPAPALPGGLPGDTRSEAHGIASVPQPLPEAVWERAVAQHRMLTPDEVPGAMADAIRSLFGMGGALVGGAGDQLFRGGQAPTQVTHTTVLNVDGVSLAQVVEKYLYNNASTYSSGFSGGDGARER